MLIRIVDIETTGIDPAEGAGVVEVAAVDIWGGRICDPLTALVNPGHRIPPEMSAIHHITDADVERAPLWRSAWQSIPIHDRVTHYAAHNAAFERKFIGDEMTGGKPWICTQKCAMKLWPDAPSFGNQALRYFLDVKLQATYANQAHRAGPDAYVTAHLLVKMIKAVGIDQLVTWSAEPTDYPRCPIGKHSNKKWSEVPVSYLTWMKGAPDLDPEIKARAVRALKEGV